MVRRVIFAILNGVAASLLLASSILLAVPTEFRRMQQNQNGSYDAGWRTTWCTMMCKIPTPNVEINQGDVFEFWDLPQTASLSERMKDAGRCAVAVARYNEKSSSKIDHSICFCPGIWWVQLTSLVALAMSVIMLGNFFRELCIGTQDLAMVDMRGYIRSEVVFCTVAALIIIAQEVNYGTDFTYTGYGSIYSTDYLDPMPKTWFAGFWLFFCGVNVQIVAFVVISCYIRKTERAKEEAEKRKKTTRAIPPGPPRKIPIKVKSTRVPDAAVQCNESECPVKKTQPPLIMSPPLSPPSLLVTMWTASESSDASLRSSVMVEGPEKQSEPPIAVETKIEDEKEPKSEVIIVVDESNGKEDKKDGEVKKDD